MSRDSMHIVVIRLGERRNVVPLLAGKTASSVLQGIQTLAHTASYSTGTDRGFFF